MKNIHLLFVAATLFFIGCSSGNDDNSSNEDVITLEINNVYLEDPASGEPGIDCSPNNLCKRDVIITDGTYTQSNTDNIYYPDDNTTYLIYFVELNLTGDFSTPNTFENLYDSDTDTYQNRGTEGVVIYTNIKVENGEYISSTDRTDSAGYIRFDLISENNFSFYIEMIDGAIYQGSYSGHVNVINQNEISFVPAVYWTDD